MAGGSVELDYETTQSWRLAVFFVIFMALSVGECLPPPRLAT